MLLVLFVVLCAGGLIWAHNDEFGVGELVGGITALIMGICIVVSGIILIDSHGSKDAYIAQYNQKYEALVYQMENDVYDNDNDLGKKELYNEIREWNEDLAYRQNIQDNFWFGIYYPNVYDQFEFIEYK